MREIDLEMGTVVLDTKRKFVRGSTKDFVLLEEVVSMIIGAKSMVNLGMVPIFADVKVGATTIKS